MYKYQPYPRSMYLNGDVEADRIVVENAEEEAESRTRGYRKAWEPAQIDPIPVFGAKPEKSEDDIPPRADLLIMAEAKSIKVDGRWSDKRLAEEIATKD